MGEGGDKSPLSHPRCLGRRGFQAPYQDHQRSQGTVKKAWEINDPVYAVEGYWTREESFLEVDSDHVWVDAIKPSYDKIGFIVRIHEYEGRRGTVSITIHKENCSWMETNLMEEPLGPVSTAPIELDIKPYEIKTIRIL